MPRGAGARWWVTASGTKVHGDRHCETLDRARTVTPLTHAAAVRWLSRGRRRALCTYCQVTDPRRLLTVVDGPAV